MMWTAIAIVFIITSMILLFIAIEEHRKYEDSKIDISDRDATIETLKGDLVELKRLKDSTIDSLQDELSKVRRIHESQNSEFCIKTFTSSVPIEWLKIRVMVPMEMTAIDENYKNIVIEEAIRKQFSQSVIDGHLYTIESDNIDLRTNTQIVRIRFGVAKEFYGTVIQ